MENRLQELKAVDLQGEGDPCWQDDDQAAAGLLGEDQDDDQAAAGPLGEDQNDDQAAAGPLGEDQDDDQAAAGPLGEDQDDDQAAAGRGPGPGCCWAEELGPGRC
ncbi:hypothetical protein CesoFtcFv8_022980 [Champsocephalus esox]|uniref:Uncharacterized protein n=2 Tax=Champsocephalus TaxID=52236 RepID=A0AAN8CGB5_CHAGU|nr:hypothetical protein CesoFtcFv8_022980 [Champsocephalus esox]KAK5903371.1 hypothetical protein CgunFtcFv8_007159 [Champsocephalus gunnari]